MNIRPFDWRDLPVLHRYRNRGLFLDTAMELTRGSMLVSRGALLSSLAASTGVYTYTCSDDSLSESPLLGQVNHVTGASFAHLSYIAPESAVTSADLPALFDHIAQQIGERGAFHILAEVDEGTPAYYTLHKSGFAIYARQRIWQLPGDRPDQKGLTPWRGCLSGDNLAVRSLYNNLVPGLVQQAEPLPRNRLKGVVCFQDQDLQAYIELRYGLAGIWAHPYVHPDAEGCADRMLHLLSALPGRRSRPVYICVRSYQSWLEPAIQEWGGQPGPLQAVMVRHLAVARWEPQPVTVPALNGKRPETTAPISRVEEQRS